MEYGCIGERLGHSFSKKIHNALGNYRYELVELDSREVHDFLKKRDFLGINVTIPYKETVIPYLYEIDEGARLIGAVNTVVNRDGELYGYNTDFFGMISLLGHAGIDPKGKKVLILGTGGTSKTAAAVSEHLGASSVVKCGRSGKHGSVTYGEAYKIHSDAEIIINTTPVGMFPKVTEKPIDISKFKNLSGIVDAIYNPLRTELVLDGLERGIPSVGGLYMLVAQGIYASEIFFDRKYTEETYGRIYGELLRESENIVLIGMPSSGKSTVGKLLAEKLMREYKDTDLMIEESLGKTVPQVFADFGEAYFREQESISVTKASASVGTVISTGGGAVLREENRRALSMNGRIYFLDRPLHMLIPTSDRPLSSNTDDIKKRYNERYDIYSSFCNKKIDNSGTVSEAVEAIATDFAKAPRK